MKTDDLDAFLAEVLGEHLAQFRRDALDELVRMVGSIPLPPFVPPQVWAQGRHQAGTVVRHSNGLFSARRDTDDEPPSEAWLPILVGIAAVAVDWPDDRTMVLRISLSDGTVVTTERTFVVPIARGFWKPDTIYREGDRVLRFGDWQAVKQSMGIDPNAADAGEHWAKVIGKQHRELSFKLDDDGRMFEGGREIGSIKPMVRDLLSDLVGRQ